MSREEKNRQAARKSAVKAGQEIYDELIRPVEDAFSAAMGPITAARKEADDEALRRFREAEEAAKEACRQAITAAAKVLKATRQESLRCYTEAATPLVKARDAALARAELRRRELERSVEQKYLDGYEVGRTGSQESWRGQVAIIADVSLRV